MVEPKIFIEAVNYFYGDLQALRNITLEVPPRSVTVFFGPAGGGKTTLLRMINRLNDMVEDTRMTGRVLLDGKNIYDPGTNVASLRRRVGMVFALPLPLPGTVRENVDLRAEAGRIAGTAADWSKSLNAVSPRRLYGTR